MTPEAEALICAHASRMIYGTPADPVGKNSATDGMRALGFTDFDWIDLEGTFKDVCAFICSSADYHLLAFRGTKVPQDWMSDLACTPVRFEWVFGGAPPIGEIHAGFGHCLSDGLNDIEAGLAPRDPNKPLLVTGHSLGGALAALVAACFAVRGSNVPPVSAVYTFGQPRIGLHPFCNTYDRILAGKLVRFVNKHDLVPRVPFRNWDYSDEGTMIHFDDAGIPSVQSSTWASFLARSLESLGDFYQIMSHIGIDVGDHSIAGYEDLIAKNQLALAPLIAASRT